MVRGNAGNMVFLHESGVSGHVIHTLVYILSLDCILKLSGLHPSVLTVLESAPSMKNLMGKKRKLHSLYIAKWRIGFTVVVVWTVQVCGPVLSISAWRHVKWCAMWQKDNFDGSEINQRRTQVIQRTDMETDECILYYPVILSHFSPAPVKTDRAVRIQ